MEFLLKVRDRVNTRVKDLVNAQIFELERMDAKIKNKLVREKIERAKRMRENAAVGGGVDNK